MKIKIALALAAASLLSVGAAAQSPRTYVQEVRVDDRAFYQRGVEAGYRAGLEHRGYRNEWVRGFRRDERRAFDRGYHDGLARARAEQSRFRR